MERLTKGAILSLVAVALEACASQVPLDNSPCPCPESLGYACCGSGSTARCVRHGAGETCPGTAPLVDASPNDGGDADDASTPAWVDAQPADGGGPDTPTVSSHFATIAIGNAHACGLRLDHTISCIGDNSKGQATPPEGQFYDVFAGADFTCASRVDTYDITRDRMLVCWGDNTYGQTSVPPGVVQLEAAGARHVCGSQTDGTLVCWGDNSYGQATVPAGTLFYVTAGRGHTCALLPDPNSPSNTAPGSIVCWGDNSRGQLNAPKPPMWGWPPNLIAGGDHTCYNTGYDVRCWGENGQGQSTAPLGQLGNMAVAAGHVCAAPRFGSGDLVCWGNDWGTANPIPPKGQFTNVFAGEYRTCAVPVQQSATGGPPVLCWGPTYEPWY